jgi:phage terminase large subunit-like protein
MVRAYWSTNRINENFNGIKVHDDTINALSAAKLKLLDELAKTTDFAHVANALGALRPER